MDLPSTIPVFALPNVVLFPGVPLPLHIFEPRYRDMVRDVAAGHEIIGIVLLRGDWQKEYYAAPDVFETGCAGKLINVEYLEDGRSNILLHGLREFEIERHVLDKSYREGRVTWRTGGHGAISDEVRQGLIRRLSDVFRREPDSPAHRLLCDRTLSDELLVNFFSYVLEIPPLEKQTLLEAVSMQQRAERLREVIDFHLEERRLTLKGPGSDRFH
jgi:Lon protease-like protein